MPMAHKKYSKTERKWIEAEQEREIDYDRVDRDAAGLLISYFRWWPDKLLDLMESPNCKFTLQPIQRMNIRAFCRYQEVFITGGRGLTKTYSALASRAVFGVVWPGVQMRYFGPSFKQTAELASAAWKQLTENYPPLAEHWSVVADSEYRFEIRTEYGSVLSITAMRGDNAGSVIAEEVAQEDKDSPFDHEKFQETVIPAIRVQRMVQRKRDPLIPQFQKLYITSAGRQQNPAFDYRRKTFAHMEQGKSAFAVDIPAEVAVLSGIRDISWYFDLKEKLTPEGWLREMQSVYTGTSENPVIRDSVLTECANLMVCEDRHCGDPNALYIVCNDVSYIDGAKNAKCATGVLKCEVQKDRYKQGHYLKSLVYIRDNPPPRKSAIQALDLKKIWWRFSLETGQPTYIAIDSASYGKSVLEDLHSDLGDGLPPLCCINHDLRELELDGALPVIYPIRATGGNSGSHDPDSEMLRYAELEFEHGNVRFLTWDVRGGVDAYKLLHNIHTEEMDHELALSYIKCRELRSQIGNLRKKVSGMNMREERISNHINRDMWSAVKYGLRLAQILEHKNLVEGIRRENPWEKVFAGEGESGTSREEPRYGYLPQRRRVMRRGGNRF